MDSEELRFNWYEHANEALIQLSPKMSVKLSREVKRKFGANKMISRVGINPKSYYALKKNRPIRLVTLKRILKLIGMDPKRYSPYIAAIGGSKFVFKSRFPINLNKKESVILIGAFMSDGNNQPEHPFYSNNHLTRDHILKAVQSLIPFIPWEIRNDKLRFHSILSRMLTKLGVPIGDKLLLNPRIPKLVYKNNEFKRRYLTQVFDDEGHAPTKASRKIVLGRSTVVRGLPNSFVRNLVYKNKIYFNSLPINIKDIVSKNQPNLLAGERNLLKEFGINSSLRCRAIIKFLNGVSADWVIELAGKENIKNFNSKIGFSHPKKIKQIRLYLRG